MDSYFDDREIALSEAERLNDGGRHAGVRVLQEDYDDASNNSKYRVVYSKTLKSEHNQDWRVEAKRASTITAQRQLKNTTVRTGRRRPLTKTRGISLWLSLIIALIVIIAGVAALIGLQEFEKYL